MAKQAWPAAGTQNSLISQHEQLMQTIDQLTEQLSSGSSRSALLITLNQLNTFGEKHLMARQRHLENLGLRSLSQHKKLHRNLLQKLAEYSEELKASDQPGLSTELRQFLQVWQQLG